MRRNLLVLFGLFIIVQQVKSQQGFASVIPIDPLPVTETTKDRPQAKVWQHAGKWWGLFAVDSGTALFMLQGSKWKQQFIISPKSSKPDYCLQGNWVYVLFYKGASNKAIVYPLQYQQSTANYSLTQAGDIPLISMPDGSTTATIAADKTGRLWVASNTLNRMQVWWSDAPYSQWSKPVVVADSTTSSDICAITYLPALQKVGLMWSDHHSKRFGFSTHMDGAAANAWSSNEKPASQSAIPGAGAGMADDHLNIKVASNGTLYCVAKTDYNKPGLPSLILLVRRPGGVWDNAYTITTDPEGTEPLLLLNEKKNLLQVVYTSVNKTIVYRETGTGNIAFGNANTLMNNNDGPLNYSSSSHENYSSEIVIVATETRGTQRYAKAILASDLSAVVVPPVAVPGISVFASPNPFKNTSNIRFVASGSSYSLDVFDMRGIKLMCIEQGKIAAGKTRSVTFDGSRLPGGIYLVVLQTDNRRQVVTVVKQP